MLDLRADPGPIDLAQVGDERLDAIRDFRPQPRAVGLDPRRQLGQHGVDRRGDALQHGAGQALETLLQVLHIVLQGLRPLGVAIVGHAQLVLLGYRLIQPCAA